MTRCFISIILLFSAIFPAFSRMDGEGTAEQPFRINDIEDLLSFREIVNTGNNKANGVLNSDIDLSEVCYESDDTIVNWHGIGNDTIRYMGHFDGNGHRITNLFARSDIECFEGIFGNTDSATIINLGVEDIYMQAGYYVGGIVGIGTNTTICNCYVTGYLKGYFVSGIIGNATNCLIANCFSTAKVGGNYNGCISGYTVNSTITNCFFNKDIQGKSTSDIATPTSTHAFETGTITRRLNEYVEASDIPNLLHWTQDASADTIPQFSPATKYNDKEADGELKIFGIRKAIVVHSSNKRNLTVCDLTGKIIYNREIENGTIITIPVAKGIYIANGVKVIVTE